MINLIDAGIVHKHMERITVLRCIPTEHFEVQRVICGFRRVIDDECGLRDRRFGDLRRISRIFGLDGDWFDT